MVCTIRNKSINKHQQRLVFAKPQHDITYFFIHISKYIYLASWAAELLKTKHVWDTQTDILDAPQGYCYRFFFFLQFLNNCTIHLIIYIIRVICLLFWYCWLESLEVFLSSLLLLFFSVPTVQCPYKER